MTEAQRVIDADALDIGAMDLHVARHRTAMIEAVVVMMVPRRGVRRARQARHRQRRCRQKNFVLYMVISFNRSGQERSRPWRVI